MTEYSLDVKAHPYSTYAKFSKKLRVRIRG